MTTITKPRQQSTKSAFDELAELDTAIAKAQELPGQLADERRQAAGNLAAARGQLQGFYSAPHGERDEAEHERLVHAANVAETAASRRWEDEAIGVDEVVARAVRSRDEFIDQNLGRLTAEIAQRSTRNRDRKVEAIEALKAAQAEDIALDAENTRIYGTYGRGAGGGDVRRMRLHAFGQISRTPQTIAARQRNEDKVHQAVDILRTVDVTVLARVLPLEFDDEAGGALPGAS